LSLAEPGEDCVDEPPPPPVVAGLSAAMRSVDRTTGHAENWRTESQTSPPCRTRGRGFHRSQSSGRESQRRRGRTNSTADDAAMRRSAVDVGVRRHSGPRWSLLGRWRQ